MNDYKIPDLNPPQIDGTLRKFALRVPPEIEGCSGITIFGKKIKSIVFTTDPAIIRNINADAVIAVYPFTPQPVITASVMTAADIPVFCGVGGGLTGGKRVANLAMFAEMQGAIGVVINAPTSPEVISEVAKRVDIPVVATAVNETSDVGAKLEAGAKIINVSGAHKTPELVRKIRAEFPTAAIMATGGPDAETIKETIAAGANAITWTPPSNKEIFREIMQAYRENRPHP